MSSTTSFSPRPEQQGIRVGALVALFLGPAFVFANMYTTQAILPVLSRAFRVDAPTAGLTISLIVLAVAVGSLFYGPLSDRIGRKIVMVGSSLLITVPTLLCAFAPNFPTLLALRALQGLLMPGLTSVAISYVNEEFRGYERGLAMGVYVSGQTLGGLFARLGSAALTAATNWQIALFSFSLPTLIAALAMWRFLPDTQEQRLQRPHLLQERRFLSRASKPTSDASGSNVLRQSLSDIWLHLHNRHLVGAFIIGFTLFFGFVGTFTYLPYYLSGPHFGLSTVQLGLVYLLWLTGLCSPIAGSLAERVGSRRAIAVSMSVASCGLVITLIPQLPLVIAGLGLLALGMFCTIPAVNLYLGEQAHKAKGTAASLYLSCYYFGGSLGAVLPGVALLHGGWPGVALLCLGTMLVAIVSDLVLC
ncbi:MFS transporter [Thermogemmatispora sp.]|uniref:MFS transporter n=1 Tax=Thermogemmatispora sp. TaxID=1968838 RepID=UPI001D64A6A9|nr:MFS transporter [Thermogemmatispora sp.]MBX5451956.1 MFS transporter [Thermogemmatispora sp.]